MINTLIGIKMNMVSAYDARGRRVGATVIKIEPNYVTQVKSMAGKDGYGAVQLGMGSKKSVHKPQLGQVKKAGLEQKFKWMREVRTEETELKPGNQIILGQVFSLGDAVKVSGTSKGKGFAGTVKRHGFAGGPKTHGQSDRLRAPGSIGAGTTPGRVYKGKRMAGHMGAEKVSTKNLEVVGLDNSQNLLIVKGAVPGARGGMVLVAKLGQIKGYTPPPEEKESEDESAEPVEQGADKLDNQSAETATEEGEKDAS